MDYTTRQSTNQVLTLKLQDAIGTGYHLDYRPGSNTLAYDMFDGGALLYGESIQADAQSIERLLATAHSVSQAIKDDKAAGTVGTNFAGASTNLAGMLQMTFKLADRSSNADVLCTLDLVHQDIPDLLGLGVEFVIPSDDLRKASDHLSALLY